MRVVTVSPPRISAPHAHPLLSASPSCVLTVSLLPSRSSVPSVVLAATPFPSPSPFSERSHQGPSAPAAPMTSDEPNAATKAATPPADGQPKPTLTATETAKAHEQQDRAVQEGKVPDAETLYSLVDDKSAERLKAMGGADTLLATLGSSREHGRDPARTEETQERLVKEPNGEKERASHFIALPSVPNLCDRS